VGLHCSGSSGVWRGEGRWRGWSRGQLAPSLCSAVLACASCVPPFLMGVGFFDSGDAVVGIAAMCGGRRGALGLAPRSVVWSGVGPTNMLGVFGGS
jgi:hypothetical protein